jgi:hypothetical protein
LLGEGAALGGLIPEGDIAPPVAAVAVAAVTTTGSEAVGVRDPPPFRALSSMEEALGPGGEPLGLDAAGALVIVLAAEEAVVAALVVVVLADGGGGGVVVATDATWPLRPQARAVGVSPPPVFVPLLLLPLLLLEGMQLHIP